MTVARDHALAFLAAFDGIDQVYDFRAMHDRDRSMPARTWRGTFAQYEAEMRALNESGPWGIHVVINRMGDQRSPDTGRLLLRKTNVVACRAQLLDLDGIDAGQQLERLRASKIPPHMIVHTSKGKVQNWIKILPHIDVEMFESNQKRLCAEYNGDRQFVDAAHTARLPGFYHHKGDPVLVTVEAGPKWGQEPYNADVITGQLLHHDITAWSTGREPLGHPAWQAPSREMLVRALERIDPNGLGDNRMRFIALTAAIKQAGWFLGEADVRSIWDEWCARFDSPVPISKSMYDKEWGSIDETSSGWPKLRNDSGLIAELLVEQRVIASDTGPSVSSAQPAATEPVQAEAKKKSNDLVMFPFEQQVYFEKCFSIVDLGKIMGPTGRMMNQTQFNIAYGGHAFVLDALSKSVSDDAWKAATRGRVWRVPVVDHTRFWPTKEFGYVEADERGRTGVNTYLKPKYMGVPGDVTPFLDHLARILPIERDRQVLLAFMAQCIQRPGAKIKWAVVIQSTEGVGKTLFQQIMQAGLGLSYVHSPAAKELTDGGGKFNGWMREKLMIVINEVKSDEKRELVEVMKPWITDERIEMQNKGQDQGMADNPTNWLMFTNHKDAIPVSKNGRRYAVMFSALQSKEDKVKSGMIPGYMSKLYKWSREGGIAHIVDYLTNYAIPEELDAELDCTDAPDTSSMAEAVELSRGWLEQTIVEAIESDRPGFRGGWISSTMVIKLLVELHQRPVSTQVISKAIQALGYRKIGQSSKVYPTESMSQVMLYSNLPDADPKQYGVAQRYMNETPQPSVVPMRQVAAE